MGRALSHAGTTMRAMLHAGRYDVKMENTQQADHGGSKRATRVQNANDKHRRRPPAIHRKKPAFFIK